MISAKHRFHGYGSLKRVYQQGQTVRGQVFSIKYLPNPKRKDYRLAVVVSRKVHKSAVARNRIRRRIYEAVRLMEAEITEPHDIIISIYSDTLLDEPAKSLQRQLRQQLKKAGILMRPPAVKA